MPVDSKDTPDTITSKSSIATPIRQKNPPKEICLPAIINLPDTLRPNFNIAPLIQAALDNNLPQMTLLLQNNANPNCMTLNGRTALHIATEHANLAMMKLLLRHGADLVGVYLKTYKKLETSKISSKTKQKGRPTKKITLNTQKATNLYMPPEPYTLPLSIALAHQFAAGIELLFADTPVDLLTKAEKTQLEYFLRTGKPLALVKNPELLLVEEPLDEPPPPKNTAVSHPAKTAVPPKTEHPRARILNILGTIITLLLSLCTVGLLTAHLMPRPTPRPVSFRLSHPSVQRLFSDPTVPLDRCENIPLATCPREQYRFGTKNV